MPVVPIWKAMLSLFLFPRRRRASVFPSVSRDSVASATRRSSAAEFDVDIVRRRRDDCHIVSLTDYLHAPLCIDAKYMYRCAHYRTSHSITTPTPGHAAARPHSVVSDFDESVAEVR